MKNIWSSKSCLTYEMLSEPPPNDVFKILVASDTHLGYLEDDPVRGEDSFNSFEEVLKKARENDVDFILLGGDLFHKSQPSLYCVHRCMSLLQQYCIGNGKTSFQFCDDVENGYEQSFRKASNTKKSIPVLSINGNHDDSPGRGNIGMMDILNCSGLLKYFGKIKTLDRVEVSPLQLKKGQTLLDIYGMSYIRDSKLKNLFLQDKVEFIEDMNTSPFHLCVLHQNRVNRDNLNFDLEDALPDFLDFIVWGHEHECSIEPKFVEKKRFFISQPGSSVATALHESQGNEKKVALLSIHKKAFKLESLKLQTVRPFVLRDVILTNSNDEQFLVDLVNTMIIEATQSRSDQQPELPLIRLRCSNVEACEMINLERFGQKFEGRVANPSTLIIRKREKRSTQNGEGDWEIPREELSIEESVEKRLSNDLKHMSVLSGQILLKSITESSIVTSVDQQVSDIKRYLMSKDVDKHNISTHVHNYIHQVINEAEPGSIKRSKHE